MQKYLSICILFLTGTGWTWSANGHKVIAQIAYDRLTPAAKKQCLHLNKSLNKNRKFNSLPYAAVWLDTLYDPQYAALKPMHYIDIPYVTDGLSSQKISKVNAISALEAAIENVKNPALSPSDRAFALRIILHVVGDIHQPLHTITRISKLHPYGDRGGNDFHLGKNNVANQLHAYWDRGGGLLVGKMRPQEVKRLARSLTHAIPCPKEEGSILQWANAAHALAIAYAYSMAEYSTPSLAYQQKTQQICKQQLVYAGCRLAGILNQISQGSL